jgi:ATP-binding cassette subfamily F protein 3
MTEYLGNYDYYLERTSESKKAEAVSEEKEAKKPNDYTLEKQRRARERKLKNDIKKAEQLIETLDLEIAGLNDELQKDEVVSDFEKLTELTEKLEEKQSELEKAYEIWEELTAEA